MQLSIKNFHSVSSFLIRYALYVLFSLLTFQFISCDPASADPPPAKDCKLTGLEFTLSSSTIAIAPGASGEITINYTSSYDDCAFNKFKFIAHIIGNNPANINTPGINHHGGGTYQRPLTLNVPAGTPDGSYTITIEGYLFYKNEKYKARTRTLQVNVSTPSGFAFSSFTQNVGVNQGFSNFVTVRLSRTGGHSENIDFTLETLPSNVTHLFDPNPVLGNDSSSVLTITADRAAVPGIYNLFVKGSDGTHEDSVMFTLKIEEPFWISLTPDSISIAQGQSNTVSVRTERRTGMFDDPVYLTVEDGVIGQDSTMVDTTFSMNPMIPGNQTSILTLTVGSAVPPGTYPLIVKGTAGIIVNNAELQLTVTE